MVREFARVVIEAYPLWFLMENVPGVPSIRDAAEFPTLANCYEVQRFNLNAKECGSRQNRLRCFQFGWRDDLGPCVVRRVACDRGVTACAMATEGNRKDRRTWPDFCELQGLPRDFDLPGLGVSAKYRAVGNGVPVPMGRVVAAAIARRAGTPLRLCICDCGREVPSGVTMATAACRKRLQRRRDAAGVTGPGPVTSGSSLFEQLNCPDCGNELPGMAANDGAVRCVACGWQDGDPLPCLSVTTPTGGSNLP